jgi:cytidine deaminase
MTDKELVQAALDMRSKAYTPYSHFQVGAAILCGDGSVFTGCNVENASYGATICAERTAAVSAVASGHKDFVKIAVASSGEGYCLPCGVCRQFLSEFSHSLVFLCADPDGNYRELKFEELLPNAFDSSVL